MHVLVIFQTCAVRNWQRGSRKDEHIAEDLIYSALGAKSIDIRSTVDAIEVEYTSLSESPVESFD